MVKPFTETNNLKPITKWVGGKRQLLPNIHDLMPNEYNKYYEPFVGGGALFFSLAPSKAVINDFNSDLINLYKVIRDNPYELCEKLKEHSNMNSKEYYYDIRDMDRNGTINKLNEIEKAARILYMLKVDFNGLYRVNKKNQFNVPYGRYKNPKIADIDNIVSVSNYFNNSDIKFMNKDFESSVIDAKNGDFVYFDPPYLPISTTSSFTSYTSDGFTLDDQKRLKKLFFSLDKKGVKVMLSNSDVDLIRDLYKDAKIHYVKASRSINSKGDKRGKVGEVIITNY